MIYEIAGLKVQMEPRYARLTKQCEAYRSWGEPVLTVTPTPGQLTRPWMRHYTPEDREYICCSAAFCQQIVEHGRFFLHASAVVVEGEAYLISAPSGTAKSTHTALWRQACHLADGRGHHRMGNAVFREVGFAGQPGGPPPEHLLFEAGGGKPHWPPLGGRGAGNAAEQYLAARQQPQQGVPAGHD